MKDDVLVSRDRGVMTLTLNRPKSLNALTFEMHDLINSAIEDAEKDTETRVLVITGKGRAFCAGDDLKESDPRGTAAPEEYTSIDWHKFVRNLRAMRKPTIAAVNGLFCGAGIGLVLGCDLRIASDKARFSDMFIKRGIVGACATLTKLLGASRALELIFTGDFIDADEAHRIGLFNRVVPHETLGQATMGLARQLADGPKWALGETKACVYRIETLSMDESLRIEETAKLESLRRPDYKNAVMAFVDKKKMKFSAD